MLAEQSNRRPHTAPREPNVAAMRTLAVAALLSSALAGCASLKLPAIIDPTPTESRLLAEQRTGSTKKSPAAQPQQAAARPALDVDRISQKLTGDVDASPAMDCPARDAPGYLDAHATWGDTLQDQQKRKACAARRPSPH